MQLPFDVYRALFADAGLLCLRTGVGVTMFLWGFDKLVNYAAYSSTFPDPLGVGSEISLGLTVLAQAPCILFVLAGCYTRISAIPPLGIMIVAAIVVHNSDPWPSIERALLYAIPFAALVFTGAGRFSIDAALRRKTSNPD